MKKIAVISDTHNLLRPEVLTIIKSCDAVIHGGDCSKQAILDEICRHLSAEQLFVVRGNNDKEWAEYLPETLSFDVEGVHIFLVHNKKFVPKDLNSVNLVIYGHSHKYFEKVMDGVTYLNPGSCGRRRFNQEISLAVVTVDGGDFTIEKVVIPNEAAPKVPMNTSIGMEGIQEILKRQAKGQSIPKIAKEVGCDPALAEEICRIIVTHPGVTAQQIMNKMEANDAGH